MQISFLNPFKYLIRAIKGAARPGAWDDYWYQLHERPTVTGRDISESTAMAHITVHACVKVIAESLSSLPLILYRRIGDGKERASDHPLFGILHDRPNPEMGSMAFRESMLVQTLLWGNSYAEIQRTLGGSVMALWPLDSSRMKVDRSTDNELIYVYNLPQGGQRIFNKEEILHIAGLGYNGLVGQSPITLAREAVGMGLALEEFSGRFFSNASTNRGVLESPKPLSIDAQKRLKDQFEKTNTGLENAHRIMVLEEGLQFRPTSMSNVDGQFLESRKFQRGEIASIYRVPLHMIGDLEHATFSNIEHQSLEFVTACLRPWAVRIEQAIFQRLLSPLEQQNYFVEHLFDGLLRGDLLTRYQAYAVGIVNGFLSVNDVHRFENMNPVPGGDTYRQQAQMISVAKNKNDMQNMPDNDEV